MGNKDQRRKAKKRKASNRHWRQLAQMLDKENKELISANTAWETQYEFLTKQYTAKCKELQQWQFAGILDQNVGIQPPPAPVSTPIRMTIVEDPDCPPDRIYLLGNVEVV